MPGGRNNNAKKEKVDKLREKVFNIIKSDRFYASTKRVLFFNEWIVRFRPTFFKHYRILDSISISSSSRILLKEEEQDDIGGETAEEKLIRKNYEMELKRCEF